MRFTWITALLLLPFCLFAQLDNTYWFFGNGSSGIHFTGAGSAPQQENFQYTPYGGEGSGVVTDPFTGQLQFYSDGNVVLNSAHAIMQNGTGLGGNPSSAQAVAMCPVPGSNNLYYIFSNTAGQGTSYNLNYSIIDMNANGGLGTIPLATKNQLLRSDINEGMVMIPRPCSNEYWLVGKLVTGNDYYVYHITSAGVVLNGIYTSGASGFCYTLTWCPVTGKIASCHPSGPVVVHDFSVTTGVLNNGVQVGAVGSCYDAEFSADGTKLYYSSWSNVTTYQYDFNTGVNTLLNTTAAGIYGGGLKMGPDGYIYHIAYHTLNFLHRIENPNAAGVACNYVSNAFNAGGPTNGLNLPETLARWIPDLPITGDSVPVSCNGGADGAAFISATGTPPFVYEWSTGSANDTISGLSAGLYGYTITDARGCYNYDTVIVTEPAGIMLSSVITDVTCSGLNNGAINLTATGGTPGYNYIWSDNSLTEDISAKAPGNYGVTVTDAKLCRDSAVYSIIQPQVMLLDTNLTHVQCFGASTGAIDLIVIGGTGPYTFAWNDGVVTEDRTGIPAGNYTVTVTDDNGCTAVLSITIAQQLQLTASDVPAQVLCYGLSTGAVNVTVAGGTPNYSYIWSNAAVTEDLTGLAAGSYTVTVYDAFQCSATLTRIITEPAGPLALDTVVTDILCYGNNTGAIDLTPSGGTPGYTYLWTNNFTFQDRVNLTAGSYSVTVTDLNGCKDSVRASIDQPAAPLLIDTNVTYVQCFGGATGAIDVTILGGTAPYTYVWSNAAITQDLSGIIAGTYTVTVNDDNACTRTMAIPVTQRPQLQVSATATNVLCYGLSTGAVNLSVTGGTTAYTYVWSNAAITEDINGLTAGTYTVSVYDAFQCSATLSRTITEPAAPLVLDTNATHVLCFGQPTGAIDLSAVGGTSPYFYQWSNASSTQDIQSLFAATYTAIVTDDNGCSETISVVITQPALPLVIDTAVTHVSCNGANDGAIDITASGGTPPYSYLWHNGSPTEDPVGLAQGSYRVTATDAVGCTATMQITVSQPAGLLVTPVLTHVDCNGNSSGEIDLAVSGGTLPYTYVWSDGPVTEDRTGLPAGNYAVTVTDGHGCIVSRAVQLTEPAQVLSVTATATDVLCFGMSTGGITTQTNGGTPGYSYQWANSVATTSARVSLTAGSYTVTVTDANGCTTSTSATVNQPAAALRVTMTFQDATCFGGATGGLDVTATDGTPPYTYNWSNGSNSEDLTGIVAGTYIVTVTDGNNCALAHSGTVGEPPAITVTATPTHLTCNSNASGQASASASGGTGAFSYAWSNGDNTQNINSLVADVYFVTVTDANGCTASSSTTVTEPDPLVFTAVPYDVSCFGYNDGFVEVTTAGGTGDYTYTWPGTAQPDNQLTGLPPGTQNLLITDENGCDTMYTFFLAQPDSIGISILAMEDTLKLGQSDTLFTLIASSPGATLSWYPGTDINCNNCPDPIVTPPITTLYTVTMEDAGCIVTDSVLVLVSGEKIYFMPNIFTPNGDGRNDILYVKAQGVKELHWEVYDRWGSSVFATRDMTQGWDGTFKGVEEMPGVYVVDVWVEYIDRAAIRYKGSVTLVR